MWLKKEEDILKPERRVGALVQLWAIRDGKRFGIGYIPFKEMQKMKESNKEKMLGFPTYVSLDDFGDLHFYPAADHSYEIEIYFHPPVDKQ